jgi:phosphatidylglycerophosphate synthase
MATSEMIAIVTLGKPKEASVINAANGITLVGIGLTLWVLGLRFDGFSNPVTFLLTSLSALTDYLDGWLARKYNLVTRLGAILDRLRDKLYAIGHFAFIYECYYALEKNVAIHLILALLIFVSVFELILFSAGIWGTFKKLRVEANAWGKRKMFCECLVLFVWAFSKDLNPQGFEVTSTASLTIVTILLLMSITLNWKSLEGYYTSYFGSAS